MHRKSISLILIFSIVFNVFISLFHFAHEGHSIDPLTGRTVHRHICEQEFPPTEQKEYRADPEKGCAQNICHAFDGVFKQTLQVQTQSFDTLFSAVTIYISQFSENIFHEKDILLFAPKNSPPVV